MRTPQFLWQFPCCRVTAATEQRLATSYSLTVTCNAGTRRTKVPIGVSFIAPAPPTSRDCRKPAKLCYADNLMRLSWGHNVMMMQTTPTRRSPCSHEVTTCHSAHMPHPPLRPRRERGRTSGDEATPLSPLSVSMHSVLILSCSQYVMMLCVTFWLLPH